MEHLSKALSVLASIPMDFQFLIDVLSVLHVFVRIRYCILGLQVLHFDNSFNYFSSLWPETDMEAQKFPNPLPRPAQADEMDIGNQAHKKRTFSAENTMGDLVFSTPGPGKWDPGYI